MKGALLDSQALYWLISGERKLKDEALVAIAHCQARRAIFVSAITVWELALDTHKRHNAPNLGSDATNWFEAALRNTSARLIAINPFIAIDAAQIPAKIGHKDPGDRFIIATARSRKISVITHDFTIPSLAPQGYLEAIAC